MQEEINRLEKDNFCVKNMEIYSASNLGLQRDDEND